MKVTKIKPAFVSGGGGEPEPPPPVEERMEVPAGGIVMYTGSSVPTGFAKVEGLAFVMVSGSTAVNKTPTGGSLANHSHTYPASSVAPAHTHSMSAANIEGGGGHVYYGLGGSGVAPRHEHIVNITSPSSDGAHSHPSGSVGLLVDIQAPFVILNFIKNTSGNLAVAPIGSIVMFDGALSSIPDGWAICDGDNDTVDMRERFAYGTNANASLLTSGGSKTHTHPTVTVAAAGNHAHTYGYYVGAASGISGYGHASSAGGQSLSEEGHRHNPSNDTTGEQAAHSHTYPAASADHMPLYIYLYYIQRIS